MPARASRAAEASLDSLQKFARIFAEFHRKNLLPAQFY
jgi:hypothetical protein